MPDSTPHRDKDAPYIGEDRYRCECISCDACNGSGQVRVRTGGYPAWDLEACGECGGYGVSEHCKYCEDNDDY